MMKNLCFGLILLTGALNLSSCQKLDKGAMGDHIGDYEWIYTKVSDTEYLTNTESQDKYGLRITEKNKLIFFKNGIEIDRRKIREHTEGATFPKPDDYFVYETSKSGGPVVHLKGDTLVDFRFPFESTNNTFLKKQ